MNKEFENFLTEKRNWIEVFDHLLRFSSEGILEKEILIAKEIFFAKLGRAHEMKEELYETASQSFLEWYLFEYSTRVFLKSPAVAFLTLGKGSTLDLEYLERSLFEHWSIYEVLEVKKDELVLEDLLFSKKRRAFIDQSEPEAKLWKVKVNDIFQTRLFPLSDEKAFFFTHLWIHPKPEDQVLKKVCEARKHLWSRHKEFLMASFEAAVRTHGIQSQIAASRSHNWMYQELMKRYA